MRVSERPWRPIIYTRPILFIHRSTDRRYRAPIVHGTYRSMASSQLGLTTGPLALVRDSGRTMLVPEDPGGEPLERQLVAPMDVGSFLRLAASIASAVDKVHQRSLVHKDIKPANILVNGAGGEVRLTGFGIASRLSRERQSPEPPEAIAGTLAYMAPEQAGRMNRSIDSRSDLYALGVTFYQMLTGALPFTAADPMERVHCHVARRPASDRVQRRHGRAAPPLAGDAGRQSVHSAALRRDRRCRRCAVPRVGCAIVHRALSRHGARPRSAHPERRDRPCAHPRRRCTILAATSGLSYGSRSCMSR